MESEIYVKLRRTKNWKVGTHTWLFDVMCRHPDGRIEQLRSGGPCATEENATRKGNRLAAQYRARSAAQ